MPLKRLSSAALLLFMCAMPQADAAADEPLVPPPPAPEQIETAEPAVPTFSPATPSVEFAPQSYPAPGYTSLHDAGYHWYRPEAVVPGTNGGLHLRYPYYSYRRPWYPAGPASVNVTIIW